MLFQPSAKFDECGKVLGWFSHMDLISDKADFADAALM